MFVIRHANIKTDKYCQFSYSYFISLLHIQNHSLMTISARGFTYILSVPSNSHLFVYAGTDDWATMFGRIAWCLVCTGFCLFTSTNDTPRCSISTFCIFVTLTVCTIAWKCVNIFTLHVPSYLQFQCLIIIEHQRNVLVDS